MKISITKKTKNANFRTIAIKVDVNNESIEWQFTTFHTHPANIYYISEPLHLEVYFNFNTLSKVHVTLSDAKKISQFLITNI